MNPLWFLLDPVYYGRDVNKHRSGVREVPCPCLIRVYLPHRSVRLFHCRLFYLNPSELQFHVPEIRVHPHCFYFIYDILDTLLHEVVKGIYLKINPPLLLLYVPVQGHEHCISPFCTPFTTPAHDQTSFSLLSNFRCPLP